MKAGGGWAGVRVLVVSPTPSHPQDAGNRKRIFRICSALQSAGAHITFMHYMADWAHPLSFSQSARNSMAARWDEYVEIVPSKAAHSPPQNGAHLLDEWWDESLEHALKWKFSNGRFDAIIVNYVWLSKAFELAPAYTFRILETHDKFSDRARVLKALGIAPEYFYTTAEEEKRGLDRADVVWAIKEDEKRQFEKMTNRQVITLPHLDEAKSVPRPLRDPDGFLRVGAVGSRNNINVRNFTAFVLELHAVISHYMAPVKVYVGGGVCDWLKLPEFPEIVLKGRVANIEEFYSGLDLVASPMIASTGLKIKTGEALSFGLPIVSTAHAFEGYIPSHPFHKLPTIRSLAEAISAISFDPSLLEELRDASLQSSRQSREQSDSGMDATRTAFREKQKVAAILVHADALKQKSLLSTLLRSLWNYLSQSCDPKIVVVAGDISHIFDNDMAIRIFDRVFVSDKIVGTAEKDKLEAVGCEVIALKEFQAIWAPRFFFVDCLPSSHIEVSAGSEVFFRPPVIALLDQMSGAIVHIRDAIHAGASVTLLLNEDTSESADIIRRTGARRTFVPSINGNWLFDYGHFRDTSAKRSVLLLGQLAKQQRTMLDRFLAIHKATLTVLGPSSEGEIRGYIEELLEGGIGWPNLAIAGADQPSATQVLLEILDRKGVERITVSVHRGKAHHPLHDLGHIRNSFGELVVQLSEHFRRLSDSLPSKPGDPDPDGGWAKLWSIINRSDEAAEERLPF